jgi:hypothetical protein
MLVDYLALLAAKIFIEFLASAHAEVSLLVAWSSKNLGMAIAISVEIMATVISTSMKVNADECFILVSWGKGLRAPFWFG